MPYKFPPPNFTTYVKIGGEFILKGFKTHVPVGELYHFYGSPLNGLFIFRCWDNSILIYPYVVKNFF